MKLKYSNLLNIIKRNNKEKNINMISYKQFKNNSFHLSSLSILKNKNYIDTTSKNHTFTNKSIKNALTLKKLKSLPVLSSRDKITIDIYSIKCNFKFDNSIKNQYVASESIKSSLLKSNIFDILNIINCSNIRYEIYYFLGCFFDLYKHYFSIESTLNKIPLSYSLYKRYLMMQNFLSNTITENPLQQDRNSKKESHIYAKFFKKSDTIISMNVKYETDIVSRSGLFNSLFHLKDDYTLRFNFAKSNKNIHLKKLNESHIDSISFIKKFGSRLPILGILRPKAFTSFNYLDTALILYLFESNYYSPKLTLLSKPHEYTDTQFYDTRDRTKEDYVLRQYTKKISFDNHLTDSLVKEIDRSQGEIDPFSLDFSYGITKLGQIDQYYIQNSHTANNHFKNTFCFNNLIQRFNVRIRNISKHRLSKNKLNDFTYMKSNENIFNDRLSNPEFHSISFHLKTNWFLKRIPIKKTYLNFHKKYDILEKKIVKKKSLKNSIKSDKKIHSSSFLTRLLFNLINKEISSFSYNKKENSGFMKTNQRFVSFYHVKLYNPIFLYYKNLLLHTFDKKWRCILYNYVICIFYSFVLISDYKKTKLFNELKKQCVHAKNSNTAYYLEYSPKLYELYYLSTLLNNKPYINTSIQFVSLINTSTPYSFLNQYTENKQKKLKYLNLKLSDHTSIVYKALNKTNMSHIMEKNLNYNYCLFKINKFSPDHKISSDISNLENVKNRVFKEFYQNSDNQKYYNFSDMKVHENIYDEIPDKIEDNYRDNLTFYSNNDLSYLYFNKINLLKYTTKKDTGIFYEKFLMTKNYQIKYFLKNPMSINILFKEKQTLNYSSISKPNHHLSQIEEKFSRNIIKIGQNFLLTSNQRLKNTLGFKLNSIKDLNLIEILIQNLIYNIHKNSEIKLNMIHDNSMFNFPIRSFVETSMIKKYEFYEFINSEKAKYKFNEKDNTWVGFSCITKNDLSIKIDLDDDFYANNCNRKRVIENYIKICLRFLSYILDDVHKYEILGRYNKFTQKIYLLKIARRSHLIFEKE